MCIAYIPFLKIEMETLGPFSVVLTLSYAIAVNADLQSCLLPNVSCAAEKERIEAQVKAAEVAAQFKLDEETRIKREQEREAARLALHMVLAACHLLSSEFLSLMLHSAYSISPLFV
jgi:hypothetical protein